MTEKLEHKSGLNLDDPDDIDWLYKWAQQAQQELEYLRSKVSPFEARVMLNFAEDEKTILKSLVMIEILKLQQEIKEFTFSKNVLQEERVEKLKTILSKISV